MRTNVRTMVHVRTLYAVRACVRACTHLVQVEVHFHSKRVPIIYHALHVRKLCVVDDKVPSARIVPTTVDSSNTRRPTTVDPYAVKPEIEK